MLGGVLDAFLRCWMHFPGIGCGVGCFLEVLDAFSGCCLVDFRRRYDVTDETLPNIFAQFLLSHPWPIITTAVFLGLDSRRKSYASFIIEKEIIFFNTQLHSSAIFERIKPKDRG